MGVQKNMMMKNRISTIIVMSVIVLLCLSSCADYEEKIIGTWAGDGEMYVNGVSAERLIFNEDMTARAISASERLDFNYAMTDDTFSFQFDEFGMGIQYTIDGDTLTFKMHGELHEFVRIAGET